MALKTYYIKIDLDSPDANHEAMTELVRQYGREVAAAAALLTAGKRAASVSCYVEDGFYEREDIDLTQDEVEG